MGISIVLDENGSHFFPIQTLYNSNTVYAFAYVCSTTLHTTHIMSKKTCFRTLNDHLCYS